MKSRNLLASVAAAGLILGAGALASPALAKDKDKAQAEAGKPNYSQAFLKAAQPAQTALKGDPAQAEAAVAAAEAAASTDDDKYVAGSMRVQVLQAKIKATGGDQQQLRAPLEALVANPKTPQAQRATFALVLGQLASQRKDHAAAVQYYTQAQQAGSTEPQLAAIIAQEKFSSGDASGASADLEAAIKAKEASGEKAPEDFYRYAVGQLQKQNQGAQEIVWLRRWVAAYPTTKNYHDALYVYGLSSGAPARLDKTQVLDLFRLMRQTKSLDRPAALEYAQKTLDAGLPEEAKAVLTEGKASGQLTDTGEVSAMLAQATKQSGLQGSLAGTETKAQASANGQLAAQTGDAYLGQGNYAKAIALYRAALQKGGVTADIVNTRLGIALALSGDKAGARTAFGAVTGAPRSDVAQWWMTWLDHPPTA